MSISAAKSYMAVVQRGVSGFRAFFPGLPCCTAIGGNLEQLRQNAEGAVFDYLALSAPAHARMQRAMAGARPQGAGMARMIIQPRGH